MKTKEEIESMVQLLKDCLSDIDDHDEKQELQVEIDLLSGSRNLDDFRDESSNIKRASIRAQLWLEGKKPDSILFV